MKYAAITSALALVSTVVAQIPHSYQTNYNANIDASPVGNNKAPAYGGGGKDEDSPISGNGPPKYGNNAPINPGDNSKPVEKSPTGNGPQKVPQGYGNTITSPVGGQTADNGPQGSRSSCLSEQEAQLFIQRLSGVLDQTGSDLGDVNATAQAIAAEDYIEYSGSILSVQGLPPGDAISSPDKADWINGVTHAPPSRGIETLQVDVACDVIYWHWVFNQVGSGEYPVRGFNRCQMTRTGQDAEIVQTSRMDIEFDSIAWGLNTRIESCTFQDGRVIGSNATDSAPASEES